MKLYSTNNRKNIVDLRKSVLDAFPADRGLYMPTELNKMSNNFFEHLDSYSFQDIAFQVASNIIGDSLPNSVLEDIVNTAINFEAPIMNLDENMGVLELFHGPTLAFKDFGARFMAKLIGGFIKNEDREQTILVATSGDTGGAVARGFYNTPGVKVIILFPKSKISFLQQQQLTTLGNNISAVEVDGSFDDCQRMVKNAFLDKDLISKYNFSSANSINIARLIPQSFYYFESFKQIKSSKSVVYSVPSGNLGNLTAGLFAKRMGLPIKYFIASTNVNDVFHRYLNSGKYEPSSTIATISNAMDVGDPSNFSRILALYSSTWNSIQKDIKSVCVNDLQTVEGIKSIYKNFGYISDPHTAVAFIGLDKLLNKDKEYGVFLSTAHPSKFIDVMNDALSVDINIPKRLAALKDIEGIYSSISSNYEDFKQLLL